MHINLRGSLSFRPPIVLPLLASPSPPPPHQPLPSACSSPSLFAASSASVSAFSLLLFTAPYLMPLSVCQQVQFFNTPFSLTDDCFESTLRSIRKHKNRCKTGLAGRPVNMDFRNELCRTLVDQFKSAKAIIQTSVIRTIAKDLAKKNPFAFDKSLQRMQFGRRWCRTIQLQLASEGMPLRSSATSRTTAPGLLKFNLEDFCSTCLGKAFGNVETHFPQHEPSLGLLLLIKKVQVEIQ